MDFKALPKIELHAHLSGSISRQCLHEIWLQKRDAGQTILNDPLLEMPPDKVDYDIKTFFPIFSKYIYALCDEEASLRYTTNAVLRDFEDDGVVYLELRTTPRAIASAGITKDSYVECILECITDHNAKSRSMKTYLILSIDRSNDLETANMVVDLAVEYRNQGVVGIDLCGNPTVGDILLFQPAFWRAKIHGLKVTIHFAEVPKSSTEQELRTLLSYEPDRLGHVIHVSEDIKEEVVKRRLGVELCLSCNVHAKLITGSYGDHHLAWWRETACPVALSTDDVGVFGSSLSNEYALVSKHFGLSRKEICDLARSPISAIFGKEDDKKRLKTMMWT